MHLDTQLQTHTHTDKHTRTQAGWGRELSDIFFYSNSRDFVRKVAISMLKQWLGPGGMARLGRGS